jgi:hypothetical protein
MMITQDRRRQTLIATVLADFDRLADETLAEHSPLEVGSVRAHRVKALGEWCGKRPIAKQSREEEAEGAQEQG